MGLQEGEQRNEGVHGISVSERMLLHHGLLHNHTLTVDVMMCVCVWSLEIDAMLQCLLSPKVCQVSIAAHIAQLMVGCARAPHWLQEV